MGNTHSEAPAQRDRELPPQMVEVHRKDREDEKIGRRSNLSSKEEQQRVAVSATFGPACVTDTQPDRELTSPVSASGPRDTAAAILDQRVKPNQGKKRKIAKARKWTSGQATAQEAADRSMGERRQSSVGAHLPGAGDGRVMAIPALVPSHQAKEPPSQHQPQSSVGGREKANVAPSVLGTSPQHGGHQEPGEGTAHSLPLLGRSTVTAKAGSRAQFTCSLLAPQGKPAPGEGQAANEKESPARSRAHPGPQETSMDTKAEGPGCTDNAQGGKGRPSEKELCHSGGKVGERTMGQAGLPLRTPDPSRRECARQQEASVACPGEEGGAGLDGSKRGPDQGRVAAPRAYTPQLSAQPLHLERGAQPEELGLAGNRKPLPPGAKTAGSHRASPGTGSGYAPVLELRISPGSPPIEAKPGPRELGDAAPGQDGVVAAATGSKKKLPFYEQLLASLKNQTQKQKGTKPQRQGQAREEASPPKPTKGHCPLEGPITSAKPLPLTIPQAQAQAQVEPPQPPLLPSPSSFHFEAPQQTAKGKSDPKALQRFQPQAQQQLPVFQFQSGNRNGAQEQARAFSLTSGPSGAVASSPQQPQGPVTGTRMAQTWLRQQQQDQARPCSRPVALAPSLYCGPLPLLPPAPPQQLSPQPRELGQPTPFRPPVHNEIPPRPQAQAPQPQAPSSNPLPPQATSNIQQQQLTTPPTPPPPPAKLESPKQTVAQASARGLQPTAGSQPQAPSSAQARPPKQEPLVPLLISPLAPKAAAPAPGQASAKGKPPAQAKVGRKASGSSLSQLPVPQPAPVVRPEPLRVQAEPEPDPESKQPAQRPTGRWSAFQIDRTCNRKCQCRHREAKGSSQLPRNIARWTNSVKEPFCETPWVRTALLAGSLVAGTKFCMDHLKTNNTVS